MVRQRRQHEESSRSSERWLLTYADLITLLMVFFVVMYATSQADLSRFAEVASSLQRAFRVQVFEGQDVTAVHGRDGPLAAQASRSPASKLAQPEVMRQSLYEAIRRDLESYAEAHNLVNKIDVNLQREGVLVSISGELLFEAGKADLQPSSLELLWVAASRLPGLPNEVRVAGHTDDVPLDTPFFPSNWELSTARALSVLHFLSEQMHINPERLVAIGYGQYRPVAPNSSREGRARNRRVELLIVDQEAARTEVPQT